MPHPSRKIVGPMLTRKEPATPDEVLAALTTPVGLRAPRCVVDEWVSQAQRWHYIPTKAQIIGQKFRTAQEMKRRPRVQAAPQRISGWQRLARRITRLFRKH